MRIFSHRSAPRPGTSWRVVLLWILIPAVLAYFLPLAASRMIGRDFLRAEAQAALSAALNRPVEIEGDVGLTLVPWFGLRIGSVVVANDPKFDPEPLLSASSVTIGLRLSQLLRKKVAVFSIALSEARFNLVRDENGRENWRIAATDSAQAPQVPGGWTVESLPTGVRLWDAQVSYVDRKTGRSLKLDHLTLTSSPSRPFTFSLSCRAAMEPWGIRGEFAASGDGNYGGKEDADIFVSSSALSGWFTFPAAARENPATGGEPDKISFTGRFKAHGEGGAIELSDLTLNGLGAHVWGQVNAAGLYENVPYLVARLSAQADRHGGWTRLLGLDLGGTPPDAPRLRGQNNEPALVAQPAPAGEISAELTLFNTPTGWVAEKAVLRDGEGLLEGSAKDIKGDMTFDVTATRLDLAPWVKAAMDNLGSGPARKLPHSVTGRLSGSFLRLGPTRDIDNVEMTVQGQDGALRLYPATLKTPRTLATADVRITRDTQGDAAGGPNGPDTYAFSGAVRVQGLFPPVSGVSGAAGKPPGASPPTLAEFALIGRGSNAGIAGSVRATLADFPHELASGWLSPDMLKGWEMLGASAGQADFRLPAAGQQAPIAAQSSGATQSLGAAQSSQGSQAPQVPWSSWELSGLSLKTSGSQITGRIAGAQGKTTLDIQLDRLDLDRLRQFTGQDGAFAPWPVEGKIAIKRLTLLGMNVDDAQAEGRITPGHLKIAALAGAALGGRLTGQAELEEHLDRRTLSLTLTAAKIQASQLRPLSSAFPKLDAPLDGHVSLDCAAKGNAPLWQGMRGVLDLQLGRGVWDAAPEGEGAASWPLNSAQANLRFSAKPAPPQSGEQPREAALVEVSGSARVDSPGMARQTQVELKGQAGLDASGKPLWYRQPKLDVVQTMDLPFNAPGKMTRVAWSGRFEADTEKGGMSLLDVEGNVGGDIPFRCAFALQPTLGARSGAKSPLAVAGHLDIPLFNVRNAAARLGYALPAEASPEAWRRARFSAQLRGTLKDLQLYSIQAALDDSAITGQIRLGGPRTKVDLSVDSLDLDKLAPESRIKPPSKRPEEPLPLAQLRSLALDSSVHIGRLTRSRLTWENLAGEFTAEGGRFRLNLQAPSFYDGPYRLDVSGDARGAELKATANLRMDRFSVPRILKDLTGGTAFPAGLADFQVDVDTRGTTDRQLRRNATGTAHIRVSDGKLGLKDTPPRPAPQPTEASDTGWNARIRQTSATPASDGSLAFSRLAASFAIRGGLAVTKDLALASNTVNARGDGWISLDDETIDLNITAGIPNVGGVPVRINGPLYDPKLNIDKAKMFEGSLVEMFKGVIRLPANILDQLRR